MAAASDISVIIPYYNREKYIDEAIQSVLAQTLKPLEIIIVNDCSHSSSRKYLDRYADVCRIIDLEKNVGVAAARNVGIQAARGQFVALWRFFARPWRSTPTNLRPRATYKGQCSDNEIHHQASASSCLQVPASLQPGVSASRRRRVGLDSHPHCRPHRILASLVWRYALGR